MATLGVQVFSATKARDRNLLGEKITEWIRSHPDCTIVDMSVMQSSDSQFHCLTIVLFFRPLPGFGWLSDEVGCGG